jgi:hypothetical protein
VAAPKIGMVIVEEEKPLVAIDTQAAWAFFEQLACSAIRMRFSIRYLI